MYRIVFGLVLLGCFLTTPLLAAPATQDAPKLEILSAKYGGGERWTDVKPELDKLRRQFFLIAQVNNSAMGGDPSPDTPKQLVIRVRLGKTEREDKYPENSVAVIVAPSDPAFVKPYEAEAKRKLIILEARKVHGEASQDWLDDVRAAVKGRDLSAPNPFTMTTKPSVMAAGQLV